MENTKFINVYIFDKNINVFKLSDEEGKTDWHKSSPGNVDDDKKHQRKLLMIINGQDMCTKMVVIRYGKMGRNSDGLWKM